LRVALRIFRADPLWLAAGRNEPFEAQGKQRPLLELGGSFRFGSVSGIAVVFAEWQILVINSHEPVPRAIAGMETQLRNVDCLSNRDNLD
jgi:hypothetical protein